MKKKELMHDSRMRPHTPHWAFTIAPTICHGGHFYSYSTLIDSVIGLFRCWAQDGLITNTNHNASRLLLIRIMVLWHRHFVLGQRARGRQLISCC